MLDSEDSTHTLGFGAMTLISGTTQNGTWERTITIPQGTATGAWTPVLYPLEGTLGNSNESFSRFTGAVKVASPTVPAVPTGAKATAGDTKATVTWTAPTSNGGSAITGYTVTSTPGGKTATVTGTTMTATVTGLTNGTACTFTVTATNTGGTGAASAKSNTVTPTAPAPPPVVPGVVERWAGQDRFASSAAFSAKSHTAGVNVAYLANGLDFPDDLSGAPIAGKTGGPVLLTNANSLPGTVATELKRLKPKKIIVLGGTGAVSTTVERQLKSYLG
jgi:hypothetical protein